MMHTKLFAYSFIVVLVIGFLDSNAPAGSIGTAEFLASYTVKFSEKEAVLKNPDDPLVEEAAAWDHPFQRIFDRNMPWIEISNEGESAGEITRFLLTIGNTDFRFSDAHFGMPIMPSNSNPSDILFNANIASDGNSLSVDFSGLDPGEKFRFRIDIDPDSAGGFPHPDFRRVLFDMNGNSSLDNAEVELRYSNGVFTTTLTQQLPDFAVTGPIFSESRIRPYSAMEPVGVFEISDRITTVIPEPPTWTMAAMLLFGLVIGTRGIRSGDRK